MCVFVPTITRFYLLALVLVTAASAQQYDPYYVLPGPAGRIGSSVGVYSDDISSLADGSHVLAMGKYSVSDELEAGIVADLGVLHDHASTLAAIQVGAKLGIAEQTAIIGTVLLPVGDVDDIGIALGWMQTFTTGELMVNTMATGAVLDGYARDGEALDLLVEPMHTLGGEWTGYLDIVIATNTDGLGDHLAIDLGPNIDINLNETAIINAGITFGLAGDAKQDDIGLALGLVMAF